MSKKSRKSLRKKVLDDEGFEEFPDRPRINELFPVSLAREKNGVCIFRNIDVSTGKSFCPNAEYCHTADDELTEFRCIMREKFVYDGIIAKIGQMPVYYDVRQRR